MISKMAYIIIGEYSTIIAMKTFRSYCKSFFVIVFNRTLDNARKCTGAYGRLFYK